MKNDNLKTALYNVMQSEIECYETADEHTFSPRFEREMKQLAKRSSGKKHTEFGLRIAASIAAAAAIFAAGTLAGAASSGFVISDRACFNALPANALKYSDTEGFPQTLETIYTLGELPDKLVLRNSSLHEDNKCISTLFLPDTDNFFDDDEMKPYRTINLCQSTKDSFELIYPLVDYVSCKELEVDGRQAYFLTCERFCAPESSLVLDGDEYIFEIIGFFNEERAVELAKSIIPYDGEIKNHEITEV